MIDIHSHILHGIDDGAEDLQESIAMARMYFNDGVRHVIATPHYNSNYYNGRRLVTEKVERLQKKLDQLRIGIQLHAGNEVRIESTEEIYRIVETDQICFLGPGKRFILLEQQWLHYVEDTMDIVKWLLIKGTTPIIPHPERHFFFKDQPDLLIRLIEAGAWIQVSVDSLLGKNSDETKSFAEWLITEGHVHTLATDTHNIRRKPNLSEGFRIVRELGGQQAADDILRRLERIISD